MDEQLKADLEGVLKRAFNRGLKKGRAEMAEELRVPILTIAVIVLAAGISIGAFIP